MRSLSIRCRSYTRAKFDSLTSKLKSFSFRRTPSYFLRHPSRTFLSTIMTWHIVALIQRQLPRP